MDTRVPYFREVSEWLVVTAVNQLLPLQCLYCSSIHLLLVNGEVIGLSFAFGKRVSLGERATRVLVEIITRVH